MLIPAIARQMPNTLPALTACFSVASFLKYSLYRSKPNNVAELLSALLNEDSTAPNKTAAKNPTNPIGNTLLTSIGYAVSGVVI